MIPYHILFAITILDNENRLYASGKWSSHLHAPVVFIPHVEYYYSLSIHVYIVTSLPHFGRNWLQQHQRPSTETGPCPMGERSFDSAHQLDQSAYPRERCRLLEQCQVSHPPAADHVNIRDHLPCKLMHDLYIAEIYRPGARFSKVPKSDLGLRFSQDKLRKNLGQFMIRRSSIEKT